MQNFPYIIAFVTGILTILSPCILPVLPSYLSYISGESIDNLKKNVRLGKVFVLSLCFVAGFSTLFILLSVVGNKFLNEFLSGTKGKYIGGGLIVFFGLVMLKIFNLKLFNQTKQWDFEKYFVHFKPLFAYVVGFSFAAGWSPCVGPILGVILTFSATNSSHGVILMGIFCTGLAIPFVSFAIFTQKFLKIFKKVNPTIIEKIGGIMMVFLGSSIVFGGFEWVVGKLSDYLL